MRASVLHGKLDIRVEQVRPIVLRGDRAGVFEAYAATGRRRATEG